MSQNLPPVVADALSPAVPTNQRRNPPIEVKQKPKHEQSGRQSPSVLVEIPIAPYDSKWPNSHVDIHLDESRAKKLLAILNGLKRDKARLNNDMPVRSNADVVRWLIDQVDDESVVKAGNLK